MSKRARILWDLDDTLNPLMRAWLLWAEADLGLRSLPDYELLTSNPPHQLCNLSLPEYLRSLDRFRLSSEAARMPVAPEVLGWFQAAGHRFEHHVLTARPASTVHPAAEWVFRNLGTWIRHFHFVPAAREGDNLPDSGASKRTAIESIGACDFFLDDTASHFQGVGPLVSRCLLIPQPWNTQTLPLSEVLQQLG
jgi:hypothetical protein